MKKTLLFLVCSIGILLFTSGCDIDTYIDELEESTKPNVTCNVDKQYGDKYGYSYYIEGTCTNNSDKDYDYLQIEFICYDKDGNNLGTALDNTNNLLGGQTWKYKAMSLSSDDSKVDHCDYHEVTGW